MKINFLDQIKSRVVFKFLYAPKMITPEGIVFSDQLHEESSLAAENVEQAQSQPRWEHEEKIQKYSWNTDPKRKFKSF